LGKAGLARKITSLDKDVTLMASDAAALSKRTGTQHGKRPSSNLELESDAQGKSHMILKDRVAKVEGSLAKVHAEVSSLEQDFFGHSGKLDASKSVHGLKNKATSLETSVKNVRTRMAALTKESDQIAERLDKLDASMEQLSSKAAALFQNIGNSNALPEEQQQDQDASFVDHFTALEGRAKKLQASVASLEIELRGAEGRAAPKHAKAVRFGDKAKALEAHVKTLDARLTSLEQEV